MSDKKEFKTTLIQSAIYNGMQMFFRLLYHPFAWTYDLVASIVSVGRWKDWIQESAGYIVGKTVLELGFGPGHLIENLATSGLIVFGVDESFQMAKQASRRMRKHKLPMHITRGLAQALPFVEEAFDSVVATFPTLYIIDPDTLIEIKRVLKPGGRLVVLMASWLTGNRILERFMGYIFRVTSQTPDEHQETESFLAPYERAGFQAKLCFVEHPGSRLLFIIARKP
jgi:ubiquinone/menaquinone biosynthesis C-methylase UbiE